jgi:hypothetical protein
MTNFNTIPFDPALGVKVEYANITGSTSHSDVTDLEFQEHGVVFKRQTDGGTQVNHYTKFIPYARLLEVEQIKVVEV